MELNVEQLIARLDQRYVLRQFVSRLRKRMVDVEDLVARLEALNSNQQLRIARISLPAMTALSPPNNQTITWGKKMPSATYNAYADVSTLLGAATVTFPAQTDATLSVRTTPSGIITLNTQILIIAWTD